MKFPQFHMQLWDRDILKWNDCIGEGILDMTKFYKKAFKRNMAVNFFETKKGAARDRLKKKKALEAVIPDTKEDVPPEELYPGTITFDRGDGSYDIAFDDGEIGERVPDSHIQRVVDVKAVKVPLKLNERVVRLANPGLPGTIKKVAGTDTFDIVYDDGSQESSVHDELLRRLRPLPTTLKVGEKVQARCAKREVGAMKEAVANSSLSVNTSGKDSTPSTANPLLAASSTKKAVDSDDEEDADSRRSPVHNSTPSGTGSASATALTSQPARKPASKPIADDTRDEEEGLISSGPTKEETHDDDAEAKDMINNFKSMTGLWGEIDPPDSAWFKLVSIDKNTLEATPKGEICYSIQLWPKEKALVMSVGAARNEPNTNPYLPPPVGRLKWSWNPFVLGSELCGPVLCAKFFCCILCIAFILLMVFCQPFLTLMINIIFFFG